MIDFRADKRFKLVRSINRFLFKPALGKSIQLQYFLAKKILPYPPKICIIPTIFDFDIIVRPHLDAGEQLIGPIDRTLYYLGTYEISTLNMLNKFLSAESVFVDVGAYVGDMTIFAALKCTKGQVFAFEPHPESYKYLLKNIRLNNLRNVSAYNMALGLSKGSVNFYPNPELVGRSSTQIDNDISPIKVRINYLDNVIPKDIKIDVLKIDTEGEELQILKSAKKNNNEKPTGTNC